MEPGIGEDPKPCVPTAVEPIHPLGFHFYMEIVSGRTKCWEIIAFIINGIFYSLNFIFPTKYVIPKSLKFSHWPSKYIWLVFQPRFYQPNKQLDSFVVERTHLKNMLVKLDHLPRGKKKNAFTISRSASTG